MYIYIYMYMYIYIYMCVYVRVCVPFFLYMCVCVCVCVAVSGWCVSYARLYSFDSIFVVLVSFIFGNVLETQTYVYPWWMSRQEFALSKMSLCVCAGLNPWS